ncbi:MAG TPA: hypothetical protein VI094_08160 [Propionibacteriaceae bacterium]
MKRPILRTAVVGFATGSLYWASWRLIRISKRWGATDSETVRDVPGDELLPQGRSTTYAISIAAPPEEVWPWLVQLGHGRGGFYTYTAIERLLGADIDNLDWIDPSLQTLKPGERIWMTPERYLGHLPGQFWRVRQVQPERALVLERKPPESPQRAIWSLVLQPAAGGSTRLLDRHRSEPRPGAGGSLSDAFWLVGTFLMERGMLRGIKARAEQSHRNGRLAPH